MKIILPIVIIGILIISGFGTAISAVDRIKIDYGEEIEIINGNSYRGDELDQYQTEIVGTNSVGAIASTLNASWAQEFTPTLQFLTRVELYIRNKDLDATLPYVVTIRDNLTGEDLTSVSVGPDEIYHDLSWVEFDFQDIEVIPGQIYYIVSYTTRVENNTYGWGWYYPDIYPNGTSYLKLNPDDPFTDSTGDCAFKTYGMESTELDIEFIKSGLSVSAIITNIGDYEAIDMVWSVDITGGILGLINVSLEGDTVLAVDDQIIVPVPFLFGFGPLRIFATASAVNADEVTEIWDGFIIFIFILGN